MNKMIVSGNIVGLPELVTDKDGEQFLIGTLQTRIQHVDWLEEVSLALVYDQDIAKIPYWQLESGDHVYLTGKSYNKILPYINGSQCSSWFYVDTIEVEPSFNKKPIIVTPIERSLTAATDIFISGIESN